MTSAPTGERQGAITSCSRRLQAIRAPAAGAYGRWKSEGGASSVGQRVAKRHTST